MAQNERIVWDILNRLDGHTINMSTSFGSEETKPVHNAYGVGQLKGQLVLRYKPDDIEDTIYFMKHRGYLIGHGFSMMPEMVFSLTEKALEVARSEKLPSEEEKAFEEHLWDFSNPKIYGVGFNARELWRRLNKFIKGAKK